jgi:hypothetical protein
MWTEQTSPEPGTRHGIIAALKTGQSEHEHQKEKNCVLPLNQPNSDWEKG